MNCAKSGSRRSRRTGEVKRNKSNDAERTRDLIYVEYPDRMLEKSTTTADDKTSFVQHDTLTLNVLDCDVAHNTNKLETIHECDEHTTKTTNASQRNNRVDHREALWASDNSKVLAICVFFFVKKYLATLCRLRNKHMDIGN